MSDKKLFYNFITGFIDFPNKYSLTLFFTKCNLNCPYCYNKHVINGDENFSLEDVDKKLDSLKKNLLKYNIGIVLSGGEPTTNINFNNVVNHFKDRTPLSLHTNGIVLPSFEDNLFDSVIIGLKTKDCGTPDNYLYLLKKALSYYKNSRLKEIRIVNDEKYIKEYQNLLFELNESIKNYGWSTKFVEKIKYD